MLGYLSLDVICSEKRTVFRERSSRKTVSFEEQTMSKDKYLSTFSPQMEAIVFIILQIFFATRAVLNFSWEIFGHVMFLDLSRTSENIWWIITLVLLEVVGWLVACIFGESRSIKNKIQLLEQMKFWANTILTGYIGEPLAVVTRGNCSVVFR